MIEIKDLTVDYKDRRAVDSVSAAFHNGELTVLAAPNGGGKSSLLRTVAGLQEKTSGIITVDGDDLSSLSRSAAARRIAYMAQSRNVPNIQAKRMVLHGRFPYLSYPRRYRKEDYEAANAAMLRTDCLELADSYVPDLSGGQRQRIYLAMTLAQGADNILMDEPLNFLDVSHQLELMKLARELAAEGKAVVMVVHDIRLAMQEADKIILMDRGLLAAAGTPEDIFDSGETDRIFNIELAYIETENGRRYYYK